MHCLMVFSFAKRTSCSGVHAWTREWLGQSLGCQVGDVLESVPNPSGDGRKKRGGGEWFGHISQEKTTTAYGDDRE